MSEAAEIDSEKRRPIDRLLRPRSVAIVGASPTPSSFGASVAANLENAGFAGELHLINPNRLEINERPCLPSIDSLPMNVDCAVLAIPRLGVLDAVKACGRRGVGGAIIFSAGFAESGAKGRAEQEEIAAVARNFGMIVEGPNCLGMVNFIDGVPLTFVLTPTAQHRGDQGIAVVSQSGAMAAVVGVGLRHRELGISFSVSTGNEAVSCVEDFAEYLLEDTHTKVILMIVEKFRQPRKFLATAARARALGKFIVLLHLGKSGTARASAETHTGAMAGDYNVMRAKVEHAGVVVTDTLEELLDVSEIFVRCPPLRAGGAAVFTESGAFKALALDFCELLNLPLPPLSDATACALRRALPEFIPPTNPLDLTAQGLVDPDLYRRTLPPILEDQQYASLVLAIILTDEATSGLKFPPIISALRAIKPNKPVIFAGLDEGAQIRHEYVRELRSLGIPFFPSPERAFRALACVTAFAAREARVLRNGEASKMLSAKEVMPLPSGVVPEYQCKQVLRALGINVPNGALAQTVEEAESIAAQVGYPVALKAQSRRLSHKSDAGGVALNLADADAVRVAWLQINGRIADARPGLILDGVLVEKMGEKGFELIAGARNDPDWGPILLIGTGGVLAEALGDIRIVVPDLPVDDLMEEILLLKCAPLLQGFRGSPALDVRAVAEIVNRLAVFVKAHPEIQEVDINPAVVYPQGQGAVALDALIVVK
jgi:acyl-CoA synthetase (NDP forming)